MNSILFFNGDIITMEEDNKNPEAVYVNNGKIKRVGSLEELKKNIDKETLKYDLKGKTLMPGFIDSHSHIVSYAKSLGILSLENNKKFVGRYINNLKIGGYKIILDGSPQGKTAWLQEPYEGESKYKGHGTYNDYEVEKYIKKSNDEKVQILAHCNGDMSARQYINAIKIIPSFFVTHVYYYN